MKSCVTQICELALKFFILIIDLVHWIVCWIQLVVKDSRIFFRWYHSWSLRFRTPFVLRTHVVIFLNLINCIHFLFCLQENLLNIDFHYDSSVKWNKIHVFLYLQLWAIRRLLHVPAILHHSLSAWYEDADTLMTSYSCEIRNFLQRQDVKMNFTNSGKQKKPNKISQRLL
jgi:hypothetical protein